MTTKVVLLVVLGWFVIGTSLALILGRILKWCGRDDQWR